MTMRGAVIAERMAALGEVLRNPSLRRAELAWGGFHLSEWAHLVAFAVVAYDAGGARAVALVGFVRMLPTALATPFVAVLADRFPRERILLGVHLLRAMAFAGAAVALVAGAGATAVYALVVIAAVPLAAHRPCHLAITPLLARDPRELVAANVAVMTLESTAMLLGPALAGIVLGISQPAVVFAACAVVSLLSAALVAKVRTGVSLGVRAVTHVRAEIVEGARAVLGNADTRLVVGLFGAQTLVRGFLNVALVVVSIELLDLGDSGVGFLSAAFGAGGLAGAVVAVGLVGRGRLGRPFQGALVCWGLPLAIMAAAPEPAVAIGVLALSGLGNTVLDVSGFTLLQQGAAEKMLGRIFGLFELVVIAGLASGSLLAFALLAIVPLRGALALVGAVLPLLALIFHRRLAALDPDARAGTADAELLRAVPIFAPLPFATLRVLAVQLETVQIEDGAAVIRQGDPGERFYLVERGVLAVTVDGRPVRELGPGDVFGEIALLLDVPRTATVTASGSVRLRVLSREAFLGAVTSHAMSSEAVERLIASRASASTAESPSAA